MTLYNVIVTKTLTDEYPVNASDPQEASTKVKEFVKMTDPNVRVEIKRVVED